MTKETLYRISFVNRGEIYEVYVKDIFQSELYGFIEVDTFVFGSRGQVVVDPTEEKLKAEFDSVQRSYIPSSAVIRIDEVEGVGTSKISQVKPGTTNVTQFPGMPPKS